jgi:hypothetical protein
MRLCFIYLRLREKVREIQTKGGRDEKREGPREKGGRETETETDRVFRSTYSQKLRTRNMLSKTKQDKKMWFLRAKSGNLYPKSQDLQRQKEIHTWENFSFYFSLFFSFLFVFFFS